LRSFQDSLHGNKEKCEHRKLKRTGKKQGICHWEKQYAASIQKGKRKVEGLGRMKELKRVAKNHSKVRMGKKKNGWSTVQRG